MSAYTWLWIVQGVEIVMIIATIFFIFSNVKRVLSRWKRR